MEEHVVFHPNCSPPDGGSIPLYPILLIFVAAVPVLLIMGFAFEDIICPIMTIIGIFFAIILFTEMIEIDKWKHERNRNYEEQNLYEEERKIMGKSLSRMEELKKTLVPNEIMDFAVAVVAEVTELAKQEDAPIYEGDKEVDLWVRLSDVEEAVNKYLKEMGSTQPQPSNLAETSNFD